MELFNTAREQIDIVKALFEQNLGPVDTFPLIKHVNNDDLIRLILKPKQLTESLISRYLHSREADGLPDVPFLVLILLSQIKQNELSIASDAKHLSSDSDTAGDTLSNGIRLADHIAVFLVSGDLFVLR